jgi:hypothetical protein
VELVSRATKAGPSKPSLNAKPILSDYEKTFKGIENRPNVIWADRNRFKRMRRKSYEQQVISPGMLETWAGGGAPGVQDWDSDGELHCQKHVARTLILLQNTFVNTSANIEQPGLANGHIYLTV